MGTLTNVIKTIFTSENANQTRSDVERLARAQTRLGSSSVSAGRQFAAQASGMGGLVAAYAGAAATSFALSAAFDALARSARATQTIEGVNTLASGIAQSGSSILTSVKDLTNGQLTLAEAAEQTNLALSAGFNSSQIQDLSVVALKASRALGRDLTDSMTRVVRGSAKMETELLDELGIYTKIEPATKAYAAALGKSVTQLSEYERRQAFVNAVISEGERKFASINTTIPTSAEQLEKLRATLSDMATQFGSFIADILAPLAGGLVNNVAAAFAAMGLVMSLVASKGIQVFTAGMNHLVDSMASGLRTSENWMRAKLKMTDTVLKASATTNTLTESTIRLAAAEKTTLMGLRQTAGTRALTRRELSDTNKLVKQNINLLQTEKAGIVASTSAKQAAYVASIQARREALANVNAAKKLPQGGGFGTPQFIARTTAINKANGALRSATTLQTQLQAQLAPSRVELKNLNTAIAQNTAVINTNNAAITGWQARLAAAGSGAIAPFLNSIKNLSTVFGALTSVVFKGFFFVSMIQLIGSSIASAIGKADEFNAMMTMVGSTIKSVFTDVDTKKYKNTLLGITGGALSDIEKLDRAIRDTDTFTFTKKSVIGVDIEITKTKEQLVKEVSAILYDVGKESSKSFTSAITSSAALTGAGLGALAGSFATPLAAAIGAGLGALSGSIYDYFSEEDITAAVGKYGDAIKQRFASELSDLPSMASEAAVKALSILQEKYDTQALIDPAARAAKSLQEQLILRSVEYIQVTAALGQTMAATAQTAEAVNQAFDFTPAIDGISFLQEGIIGVGNTRVRFLFIDDMNEELKKVLETVVLLPEKLNNIRVEDLELGISDAQFQASIANIQTAMNAELSKGTNINAIPTTLLYSMEEYDASVLRAIVRQGLFNSLISTSGEAYGKLSGAINSAQSSLLMTTNILATNNDQIARGVITLEQFYQNTDSVKNAIIAANIQLEEANKLLPGFIAIQNQALAAAKTDEERQAIQNVISATQQNITNLEETIVNNRAILAEQLLQESSLKRQIELTSFLKEQGKGVLSDIDFQYQLATAGAENATAASLEFFNNLVSGNKMASVEAKKYQTAILDLIDADKTMSAELSINQKGAILAANLQNVETTRNALKDVKNGLIEITDTAIILNGKSVSLTTQASQAALGVVEDSTQAIKKLGQQAAIEVESLSKQFTETVQQSIDEVSKALADLGSQQRQKQLRFEIDMLDIQAQGAQAAFEFEEAFKENQIRQVELNVDLQKITPVQGATEINALEADIQGIRSAALEAERVAAAEKYLKEAQLRQMDKEAAIATITMEANATKAKIAAEFEVIRAAATVYQAIASQLGEAIVTSGNQLGDTLVNAAYAAAQTLASAFGPIGRLLGIGSGVQRFDFAKQAFEGVEKTAAAIGAIGVDAYVEQVTTPVDKALSKATEGLAAANAAQDILARERIAATEADFAREKELADARYRAEADDLVRRASLLAQKKGISQAEAEKRLRDAEGAGGGGKSKDEKELDKLTGRLAELKSSLQGTIESAFMALNRLIITGEGSIGEIIGSLFMSIQEEVFKQTIATPLSNWISSWLVGGIQQAFSNKDILGSPLSGVVGSIAGATGDALQKNIISDNAVNAGAAAFNSIGTKLGGAITGAAATVQTAGTVGAATVRATGTTLSTATSTSTGTVAAANTTGASTLMASLGPILAVLAVIAIIASLFGKKKSNSTSSVLNTTVPTAVPAALPTNTLSSVPKFAAGGMLRDRVPALLEPGEFVIRKPIAKQIGTPALQAMNANGKTPNAAPVININNQGAQKEVESAKPRFDGEKYVIDIIMRDLANNGPIRKSLRGGAI